MDHYYILARALHVVAVVLWIGGVAFVTTVLIPALRKTQTADQRIQLFEDLEGRFGFQAKLTTVIAGLTGFYMLYIQNIWQSIPWWIYLMIMVWAAFTLVLFVLEPLVLHKTFQRQAQQNTEKTFIFLHVMHVILLTISLLAVFFGVLGTHGFFY